jgi:anti-anti-sigma factor
MPVDGSETEAGAADWGLARVTPAEPGGVNVVALSGDLTKVTAPAVRTALIDALGGGGPRLVIDLSAVRSCDDVGVHAIALAAGRALRRGGAVRLAAVPPRLGDCFSAPPYVGGVFDQVSTALSTPWRIASALSAAG